MPSSRQARATRTAISPRLAISTRRSGFGFDMGTTGPLARSERNVPVLLRRVLVALVLENFERADEPRPCLLGCDDLVDVAELGGHERVREGLAIVGDETLTLAVPSGGLDLAAEDDVDRALRTHDRDLPGRIHEVHVAADVLRRHDDVRAAVGLAGDDRDLRYRRLAEGVEQLGAVLDDAAVLLLHAGKEAGDVDEGDDRDVEAVAEADEARRLDRGVDVETTGEKRRLV